MLTSCSPYLAGKFIVCVSVFISWLTINSSLFISSTKFVSTSRPELVTINLDGQSAHVKANVKGKLHKLHHLASHLRSFETYIRLFIIHSDHELYLIVYLTFQTFTVTCRRIRTKKWYHCFPI